ncbi:MAG: M23 family metallopeptidase [Thermoanaerobaculia bacterium]|nr:M23 family metallopeptidase [Thermoanaerobaculia bacterium]
MIEVQIHPADIRRKVRYFFFGERTVAFGLFFGVVLLIFVIGSMAAAPSVMRRSYRTAYLKTLQKEQAVEYARLDQYLDQMGALERSLDDQRIRIDKLTTIYGLSDAAFGKGGGIVIPPREAELYGTERLEFARSKEKQLAAAVERLRGNLQILAAYEDSNEEIVRHTPAILPVPEDQFVLTSPYGARISPFTRARDFHRGLDLAAPEGTPIYATADGEVTFAGRYPMSRSVAWWRFGNVVVLNHANRFITIYAHCNSVNVRKGQKIRQGDVIGFVGSTGWSTNSHLHYEVRTNIRTPEEFTPVDPRIYILNHRWSDEEALLIRTRSSGDQDQDFDPLPSAFIGRRGA